MTAAIIVAAGSSSRMGFDKLTASLLGTSVLQRSLNAFAQTSEISEIIIVTTPERFNALKTSAFPQKVIHVEGGNSRQESVSKGLEAVSENIETVSIHDGARPLITPKQISKTIAETLTHSATATARRITETVKYATPERYVSSSVDRENLWIMETPQTFQKTLILKAYSALSKSTSEVTDEVSAMDFIGVNTYLVENPDPNPKITYPQDLELAEKLLTND